MALVRLIKEIAWNLKSVDRKVIFFLKKKRPQKVLCTPLVINFFHLGEEAKKICDCVKVKFVFFFFKFKQSEH